MLRNRGKGRCSVYARYGNYAACDERNSVSLHRARMGHALLWRFDSVRRRGGAGIITSPIARLDVVCSGSKIVGAESGSAKYRHRQIVELIPFPHSTAPGGSRPRMYKAAGRDGADIAGKSENLCWRSPLFRAAITQLPLAVPAPAFDAAGLCQGAGVTKLGRNGDCVLKADRSNWW